MDSFHNIATKRRLINDPIYGFITLPDTIISVLAAHPYFQRLRRITQLGLTHYVYPGAVHTRFQHTLGALHLLNESLKVLQSKGVAISNEEATAAGICILMHDIGHGPFSHTLEKTLVHNIHHEYLSHRFMLFFNDLMKGELDLALKIFKHQYERKFFHQLISSQIDVDRLDYLQRDSFFTGVQEGTISSERIINLLHVHQGELVVEEKGIYSVEKFLMARRLMYWQVYLHKTVLSAEFLLVHILQRAKALFTQGEKLPATHALTFFLSQQLQHKDFESNHEALHQFAQLDDYDVFTAVKTWTSYPDNVLSTLCQMLLNRQLFAVEVSESPKNMESINQARQAFATQNNMTLSEAAYFIFSEEISNQLYPAQDEKITFLFKDNTTKDIIESSEYINNQSLTHSLPKYFFFYPKNFNFFHEP